jgi:hypothetical protein
MVVGEEESRWSRSVVYGLMAVLGGTKKGLVFVDEDIVKGEDMAAVKIPALRWSGNAGNVNRRWSCERRSRQRRKLRKVARLNEVGAFLSWAPTRLASHPFPSRSQLPTVSTSIPLQQTSNK